MQANYRNARHLGDILVWHDIALKLDLDKNGTGIEEIIFI